MQVRIATIVPIHNELESTKRFLCSYFESLSRSGLVDQTHLVIVDDGSTDGSSAWIQQFYPGAKILTGDADLWWSGSVNAALKSIEQSAFTHFLLFNNDNIVHSDFFTHLAEALEKLGVGTIISSKVINLFPEQYVIYGGVTLDRKRCNYLVNPAPDQPALVNTAGGMGVLVPMKVLRQIGLFDAVHLPQKSGDTDFYLRAEKAGFLVHYRPELTLYNDNRLTGFSGNRSFGAIRKAYSFPKGYMNLSVDFTLFMRHCSRGWALYRIVKKNVLFLGIGCFRIVKKSLHYQSVET